MFWDIKQNNGMEFPSMAAYVSLWVFDGDEFSTHKSHAYGLSKICNFMCIFRLFLEMKPPSHTAHSNEFSLV